jgi:GAF domain-containing protein
MSAFAELGKINLSSDDLTHVLGRVSELAKSVIRGVVEASVTLLVGGQPATAAFTGPIPLQRAARQSDVGTGPGIAAARERTTHYIDDSGTDDRWPQVMVAAKELGVRSILSVGIPVRDVVASGLNLYSTQPSNFDDDSRTLADTFANYAAVAIANAYLYSTTAALADQMSAAMQSRAIIEQAKGVLMARQNITAQDAFDLLAKASQTSNRKLREIADGVVRSLRFAACEALESTANASSGDTPC